MSITVSGAKTTEELRAQVRDIFKPHTTSCQALGDVTLNRHNDGEHIYKEFRIPPFHKYLARCEKHDKNVARYPSAWVKPLVHVDERDKQLLEQLSGEVDYDPRDPHPSHEALDELPPLRAKTFEWVAADDGTRLPPNAAGARTVDTLTAGGTDIQIYGEPGSGKTTLMQFMTATLAQLNNETVLWADTLDDSYTNERAEWIPLAPWTTVALPKDIPVSVRIVPRDATLDAISVDIEDICRDVIRYSSPRDLNRQLIPGQIYVVYPDPLMRGCEDISRFSYHGPQDVDPSGEQGPTEPTPPNHWWFAYLAARISQDDFLHYTSVFLDEAGNLLDPDASKDAHDTYQKIVWWSKKLADARKKGVSVFDLCHALSEIHQKKRKKQRWWMTMNGTAPPLGKTMPGQKTCPMERDYTSSMRAGQAQVWTTQNFASISWPNMKRARQLDAEVSIDLDVEAVV